MHSAIVDPRYAEEDWRRYLYDRVAESIRKDLKEELDFAAVEAAVADAMASASGLDH